MSDVVLLSREGDVATVTLNRPDRLNAFDKAMWQRLTAIMAEVTADGAIRSVIHAGPAPPSAPVPMWRSSRASVTRRPRGRPTQRSWAPR